jgi:hypothetical protein
VRFRDVFLRHRHEDEDMTDAALPEKLHEDVHLIRRRQMELERRVEIVEARTESIRRLLEHNGGEEADADTIT